jgi:hypothetical protein
MVLGAINLDTNEAKAYIAIAVGMLGLAYLWLRSLSRKRRDPLERAPFAGLSQQRAVEREFQSLLVEMAEMSRQISAQLDTRSEKLNLLIEEADAKIAELRRLQGGAGTSAETSAPPNRPSIDAPLQPSAFTDTDSRHAEVYAMAEQGHSPQDIARRLDRPRGEIELILALRPAPDAFAKRAVG